MAYEQLLARIDEGLKRTGLSERKACLNAKIGVNTIRHIRIREHAPKADNIAKLAKALGYPPEYLLDVMLSGSSDVTNLALSRIFVRGAVQAGVYREATEWPGEEWYSLSAPTDRRFPGIERFGLEVRGNSMNALYPEGTVVIVVRFGDIGRGPEPGERVIVFRRAHESSEYEATLKEYDIDDRGRHILWPRSNDPEFQTPFILNATRLRISHGYEPMPSIADASDVGHAAGEPDLTITALVVGSYRRE